jgi:superfamily II DNA/RNA helicase
MKKMIIFASTNDSVEFHEILLKIFLNHKFNLYFDDEFGNNASNSQIEVFKLYGNLNQNERTETLNKFRKAQTGVLLCTVIIRT